MPTASGLRARFMRSTTTCVHGVDALVDGLEVALEAARRDPKNISPSRPKIRRRPAHGVVGQPLVHAAVRRQHELGEVASGRRAAPPA